MVVGFPNEFKQVILNILNNAFDAILQRRRILDDPNFKGKITIQIRTGTPHEVVLEITDNGGGIPEGIIHRVFEPYFTTKEEGKGTGIGLYMSKVIIESSMKGSLQADNVDQGARFTIRLEHL